jgi:cytoskeleton protein RodZ
VKPSCRELQCRENQESFVSIGQALSAARRDAGLSVDDISAKTRLRATVVRAIEADDFSLCGGDFYARGHIRTLAGLVGLDPVPLLAEYDATIGLNDDGPATTQLYETEASGRAITRSAQKRAPNWGLAGAAMVLVVIIIVAVVGLTNRGGKGAPARAAPPAAAGTSSAPPSSPSPAPVVPVPVASPLQSPTEVAPSTAVAEVGVHIVVLVTTKKCWIEATGSNGPADVLYQGVLNAGETRTFDDPQRVSLRLGNAPATDLTVNGVDIGAPPSKTAVTSVSFGPGNPLLAQG